MTLSHINLFNINKAYKQIIVHMQVLIFLLSIKPSDSVTNLMQCPGGIYMYVYTPGGHDPFI